MKSIVLGYLLIFSFSLFAMVPVEGILMGEANTEYQHDPLNMIFRNLYDKTQEGENQKFRLYQQMVAKKDYLTEACSIYHKPNYATPWQEKQAKRAVVSTLQYIGLDTSIKAIGAYAHKMEMTDSSYQRLTNNLVKNYCSKNVTVYSIKRIQDALKFYFTNPEKDLIPTVANSPFATTLYKEKTESSLARSNEFDQAINNFKAFCSWGGDVADYRLMVPYLKNSFIMAFLIKNISGKKDVYDPKTKSTKLVTSKDTVQVSCNDLICRKTNFEEFKKNAPLTLGSSGLFLDLSKLYCHHFRTLDYSSSNTIPQIKTWIKKMELEDPIFETSFFISLMTGVPDAIFGMESYRELATVAKSSIDDKWNIWSNETLNLFSHDMFFEESLEIKPNPIRDNTVLRSQGFLLDFSVTLGELDRIMGNHDKITTSFELVFAKNELKQLIQKWTLFTNDLDTQGADAFKKEMAKRIDAQLKTKESYFRQKMWNEDFSMIIVNELLGQLGAYKGPLFENFDSQMIKVPVKFSYGVFAISYLRYRSDVKQGRLKLNL